MSPNIFPKKLTNQIIGSMLVADFALVQMHLKSVALPLRMELEVPNVPIETLFFLDSGVASVVSKPVSEIEAEVGFIGLEGMTGLAVLLGSERTPYHTYMQVAGKGRSIPVKAFRAAIDQSETLHNRLLHYANAFAIQIAETATANARGKVQQRLARWILMAHDRLVGDEIPLTHEFLSIMLGTRRASVTEALQALERRRVVTKQAQGILCVLNRKGLEKIAGGFYGVSEREYKRLMG